MRKLSLLLLFFALSISCKKQETSAQSTRTVSLNSCTIGKWAIAGTPLNLKMSSEFAADYTNADLVNGLNPLEQMAKVWNTAVSPSVTLFTLPFGTTTNTGYNSLNSFRDSEMGIYKSHTWFSGVSSSALAITQYYGIVRSDATLGNYIDLTHADIIFNYRDFSSDFTFTGNPLYYDVPTVLLHEMGHFLGLCHTSTLPGTPSSIMAPYYYTTQRSLKSFDTSKIQGLYWNNQNINAITAKPAANAITTPPGTVVKGIVELNANGLCRHYLNGKVVYEHTTQLGHVPAPKWYKNLPLR